MMTFASPVDFVDYGIKILSLTYQSPTQYATKHIFVKYLASVINILIMVLIVLDLIKTGLSENLSEIVRKCEWLILFCQVSRSCTYARVVIRNYFQIQNDQILSMILYRKIFNDLLRKRKQLGLTDNMIFENNIESKIFKNFQLFVRLFAFLCAVVMVYCVAFSFYSRQLIFPTWYPKDYPLLRNCLFYAQWVWVVYIALFQYGCVTFFNGLYIDTTLQFHFFNSLAHKVLKEFMKSNQESTLQKMIELANYHRLLIRSANIEIAY